MNDHRIILRFNNQGMLGIMLVQMSSMRDALAEALLELGAKDPRVVVLGADTSVSIKTSLFADRYPDRFFNVGIPEANLFGIPPLPPPPVKFPHLLPSP